MVQKYKKYIKFLSLVLFFIFSFKSAFAATLTLTKIGALELGGKTYPEWWYTGTKPVFYGTAQSNASVSIKIADQTYTSKADTSGNWSYASTIEKGDFAIEITSLAEKISLTLHNGQAMPDSVTESSTSASTTPSTGFNQFIGITFGAGIILLSTYLYFSTDNRKKTIFENRMLKED